MSLEGLITVVLVVVVLGLGLWLIEQYVPMSPPFKTIVRVIVIFALILYLLSALGLWSGVRT